MYADINLYSNRKTLPTRTEGRSAADGGDAAVLGSVKVWDVVSSRPTPWRPLGGVAWLRSTVAWDEEAAASDNNNTMRQHHVLKVGFD